MSGMREQQLWLTSHHPPPALSRQNTSDARRAADSRFPAAAYARTLAALLPKDRPQQGVKDGGHVEKRSEEEELRGTPVRATPQITSASIQSYIWEEAVRNGHGKHRCFPFT